MSDAEQDAPVENAQADAERGDGEPGPVPGAPVLVDPEPSPEPVDPAPELPADLTDAAAEATADDAPTVEDAAAAAEDHLPAVEDDAAPAQDAPATAWPPPPGAARAEVDADLTLPPLPAADSDPARAAGLAGVPAAEPPPVDLVAERLARLETTVAESNRLAARHAEMNDRLYADVQRLRAGELHAAQAPLLRDVVRLYEHVARLEEAGGGNDLTLVRDQVVQVLARAGVELLEPALGDRFDPARHDAVARTPVDDPAQDRTIAAVRRAGFVRDDGRVLAPAQVEVAVTG